MVTQNMLRPDEGKQYIDDCSRSNQVPYTDKISDIAPLIYLLTLKELGFKGLKRLLEAKFWWGEYTFLV